MSDEFKKPVFPPGHKNAIEKPKGQSNIPFIAEPFRQINTEKPEENPQRKKKNFLAAFLDLFKKIIE